MIFIDYPFIFFIALVLLGIWYLFFPEKRGYISPNPIIRTFQKKPIILVIIWISRAILLFTAAATVAGVSFLHTGIKSIQAPQHIVIVFDISRSMLAEDIEPNRITRAKLALQDFLKQQKNTKISLIIFAGKPFVSFSDSQDISGMLHFLDTLTPYTILQEKPGLSGTNIGDALLLAYDVLTRETTKEHLAILLLTDGSANIGIDPLLAAEQIKTLQVPIFSIAIGSKSNEPLFYTGTNGEKKYFYDELGKKIIGDVDINLLQKLAINTRGQMFTAENSSEMQGVFQDFQQTNSPVLEKKYFEEKQSLTEIFLGIFLVFVFLDIVLQYQFRKKYFSKL